MQEVFEIKCEVNNSLFDSLLQEADLQQIPRHRQFDASKIFPQICISQEINQSRINLDPSEQAIMAKYQEIQFAFIKQRTFGHVLEKDLRQTKEKDEEQRKNYITSNVRFAKNSFIIEQSSSDNYVQVKRVLKYVFKEKEIKKGFKKNTNVPKFLVRIFMKHFMSFVSQVNNEKLIRHYKRVAKALDIKSSNCFTISDVLFMLRNQNDLTGNITRSNQRIMSEIIQSILEKEIVQNKCKIENQISYMIAAKIYNLRCRSKTLTERVKIF